MEEKRYEKSSKSLRAFFKTEEGKALIEQKRKNISAAKLRNSDRNLKEDDIKRIEEVLSWGYMTDRDIILNQAGIEKSKFALDYYIKNNPGWWERVNPAIKKYVPRHVQAWPHDKWLTFLKEVETLSFDKIIIKYEFNSIPGLKGFCKKMGISWKNKEHWVTRETKPEQIVRQILEELGIDYLTQKCVNKGKFRLDFFIQKNKVIEVQGDFWHANPKFYNYDNLALIQQKNILRDTLKKQWLIDNGFDVLYLWENDLHKQVEGEIDKIQKFLNGK